MSNGEVNYTFGIDLTDDCNVKSHEEVITVIAHSASSYFVDELTIIAEFLLPDSYS
jgi:hypothetical protein